MYKLVIADDERIIRQGLKNVVDWKELGFEVTELFTDGQEVIEYLEYAMPDVVLTDIKMNHVSGLGIAKYVSEHQLPCKVVLISGHQEFDLAIQGIKYGAEAYLLKPTSVDEIESTFRKLKEQLDNDNIERQKKKADRERMEEALPLLEEHFFTDLVMGVIDSKEYINSHIGILYPEMELENSPCFLMDITIEEFDEFMEEIWEYNYDQFEVNLVNFLRIYNSNYSFHLVYKSGNILEIIGINIVGNTEIEDSQNKCREEQEAEKLLKEMEYHFHFKPRYTIRKKYKSIVEMSSLRKTNWIQDDTKEFYDSHLQEQKKLVMSNITMGNIVTAQKIFHNILEELTSVPVMNRNNIIIDILSTLNTVVKEVNEKLSQSLQSYFNYSFILSMTNAEEVKGYCDRIFDRIKIAEEKKEYYDTNSLVNKAKAYIQENIYQDVSQEEIANQLYICPSYLSRLFKKQTVENFTQFVTRTKMEKAIELLKDPQYKTYQVSEMLGYKTPRYFSRLFRVHTGMNPSEYRGKVLQVGGEYDEY